MFSELDVYKLSTNTIKIPGMYSNAPLYTVRLSWRKYMKEVFYYNGPAFREAPVIMSGPPSAKQHQS